MSAATTADPVKESGTSQPEAWTGVIMGIALTGVIGAASKSKKKRSKKKGGGVNKADESASVNGSVETHGEHTDEAEEEEEQQTVCRPMTRCS
jgi:hypothetical protein